MNDSVREFAFEIYGKVKKLKMGRGMGQTTRQPPAPTRAELEKRSREYRLVLSDDDDDEGDKKGGKKKGNESKFGKDKAARKSERKDRRRNRKKDKESDSDEDRTVVVHRRLKREDEEVLEETDEAKKEVNQTINGVCTWMV